MAGTLGADSTGIRFLTKQSREGAVYTRRADAEAQIEKVSFLEPARILEIIAARKRREEDGFLLDETIVYLFRQARRTGNEGEMFNLLYDELNLRILKKLGSFRANFKQNAADFDDFVQKVELSILRKLLDTDSDAADFAEVQFGSFVLSEAKAAWKQNLVAIKRDQEFLETPREEDDENNASDLENLALKSDSTPEKAMILKEMMKNLTPDEQIIAAMLGDGFQIESKNENELTISKHLGVTSRTIRTRIREMREKLAEYQGELRK
ncbi:MAG: hypothetical protein ACR2L1_07305 [Pyrinomonadaceae bacterium]